MLLSAIIFLLYIVALVVLNRAASFLRDWNQHIEPVIYINADFYQINKMCVWCVRTRAIIYFQNRQWNSGKWWISIQAPIILSLTFLDWIISDFKNSRIVGIFINWKKLQISGDTEKGLQTDSAFISNRI